MTADPWTVAFWTLALLGHFALWVEIVNRVHAVSWPRWTIDGVTLLGGVVLIAAPLAAWFFFDPESNAFSWIGAYFTACLAVAAISVGGRLARPFDRQRDRQTEVTQRNEVVVDAPGSPTVARLARLPGNQLLKLQVERRRLCLERLPAALDGLRIVHLTDLHLSGRIGVDYFHEAIRAANAFEPDLVCLTGDIVECPDQLAWVRPLFEPLRPRHGAFFCLGNHDRHVDIEQLQAELTASGFRNAASDRTVVETGDATIVIGGDERPWFDRHAEPRPNDPFNLCLAHTPDRFAWAQRVGFDLVLAGHNHGGQVCFPLLGPLLCPSQHGVRYASGTFRAGKTVMHVSRGTGSLFPLRYLCPPELGLLTLTRA